MNSIVTATQFNQDLLFNELIPNQMSKLSMVSKLIRLPLRLIPRSMTATFLYGPLKGFKWITGSSNHGYWLGLYETKMKGYIQERLKKGDVMFDFGAHVGYYSILGSRLVGKEGKVFSFEPLPRNIAFLKQHLSLNHISNVKLYEGAIAHFEGFFNLDASSPIGAKLSDRGTLQVKVYALRKLWESNELPIPQVIKMDIEGAELHLLQDVKSYLSTYNITLFLSTHGRDVHKQCIALLSSLNYEFKPLDAATVENCTEVYCFKK